MKYTNEALRTVRQHGAEHTLWCMSLKSAEVARLRESDPDLHERVKRIRNAMNRQLAINTRNVSRED
jgi:hypothetical protein